MAVNSEISLIRKNFRKNSQKTFLKFLIALLEPVDLLLAPILELIAKELWPDVDLALCTRIRDQQLARFREVVVGLNFGIIK